MVKAERDLRRPGPPKIDVYARAAEALRNRPALAHVDLTSLGGEFVVLLARAGENGLDIVATVEDDDALTERAVRKAAA